MRLLHLECGFPNPLKDNWSLSTVLRGVKGEHNKPHNQLQMMPITPDILRSIHTYLDLSQNIDKAFWAACVCSFFTFFRKCTLFPVNSIHNCDTELCRKDAKFNDHHVVITVKHTKTIQFKERLLQVPVPCISKSVLCPVAAVKAVIAIITSNTTKSSDVLVHSTSGTIPSPDSTALHTYAEIDPDGMWISSLSFLSALIPTWWGQVLPWHVVFL